MTISFGNYNLHFQLAPLYGVAMGYIYYAPDLEDDFDSEEEDNYGRHQLLFLFVALIVDVWKS
jgi:hypothetical protein